MKKKKQSRKNRVFSAEFKVSAVKRIEAGEPLLALSREFGIKRSVLYRWREAYRKQGPPGIARGPGRPPLGARPPAETALEAADRKIAELERTVGQQTQEIRFLKQAFKRVEEIRRRNTAPGGTASTERSGA